MCVDVCVCVSVSLHSVYFSMAFIIAAAVTTLIAVATVTLPTLVAFVDDAVTFRVFVVLVGVVLFDAVGGVQMIMGTGEVRRRLLGGVGSMGSAVGAGDECDAEDDDDGAASDTGADDEDGAPSGDVMSMSSGGDDFLSSFFSSSSSSSPSSSTLIGTAPAGDRECLLLLRGGVIKSIGSLLLLLPSARVISLCWLHPCL